MLIGRFMIEDIKEEDSVLLINEIKMKKYNWLFYNNYLKQRIYYNID
jgi:hypothetical protein